MRKADGTWRSAVNHHNQVVANVVRLRQALSTAEAKEAEAALEVAKTEAAKRKAAHALAHAEGVGQPDDVKNSASKPDHPPEAPFT
eukprot:8384270-Pyramimonas_sp.AAC.1